MSLDRPGQFAPGAVSCPIKGTTKTKCVGQSSRLLGMSLGRFERVPARAGQAVSMLVQLQYGAVVFSPQCGCTLGGNFQFLKDRESVILGGWAALGIRDTIPLGGGLRPPPFARVSGAPGAAQTLKMIDFRPLYILYKFYSHPKCSQVKGCGVREPSRLRRACEAGAGQHLNKHGL